jgi:hypothetical protein
MGNTLSSSLPNELIIKCIWPFKIKPLSPKLNVLCNLCITNRAWKSLIDSSSNWGLLHVGILGDGP